MAGNLTKKQVEELLAKASAPKRNGNLVTYNPLAERQQVMAAATAKQPDALDAAWGHLATSGKPAQQKKGGILGAVLNNPIGKAVAGALGALDIPRSYVVSGVKELGDLGQSVSRKLGLPTVGGDTSTASWQDFLNQARDHYGYGQLWQAESPVAGQNKWLDRAAGFAGDVALDPLTYITLGAGKFAGQSGRVAAAERVAEAAKLGDLGAESVGKIGRLGVLGANEAERAAIFKGLKGAEDLAQPGLRFAGQRIPGTGKLAEGIGQTLTHGRAALGETRLGAAVRGIRAPKGLEDAYRALAEGGDATKALEQIAYKRVETGEARLFPTAFSNEADKLVHNTQKAGTGEAVLNALDKGLPTEGIAHADEWKGLFAKIKEKIAAKIPGFEGRADFVPHIATDDFLKATKGDRFEPIRKALGIDTTQATGGVLKRTIHPGSTLEMPDGQVLHFVADTTHGGVSAEQINAKLGGALGGIKVFETDISKVIKPYIDGVSKSVGRAEALKQVGKYDTLGGLVDTIDKTATKRAANAEVKDIGKQAVKETKVNTQLQKQLARQGGEAQTAAVGQLEKNLADATGQLEAARAAERQATNVVPGLEQQRKLATQQAEKSVTAAQQQLDQVASEQANLARTELAARQSQMSTAQQALDERRQAALKTMGDAERTAQKRYAELDAAKEAATVARMDSREAQKVLSTKVSEAKSSLARARRINVNPSKGTAEAFSKVQRDLEAVVRVAGDSPEMAQTASLLGDYSKAVGDLRDGQVMTRALKDMEKAVKSGDIQPVMKKVIQDGYEQIGVSLLGADAPIVRKELARQLTNLQVTLDDPGVWRMIDKYTQYFKTYATAKVGFHVRNALDSTFKNGADGVSVRNMGRGLSLWNKFERDPEGFLKNLPEWINPDQADTSLRAVFYTGGGGGQYGKAELVLGHSKLINNPYTRASQRIGERVEGSARMAMALDSVLEGQSLEQTVARISRIHFNYSEVSKFDAQMKRLIPFWTFLSRNAPMSVQQMFLKPRLYQQYNSLARAFGQDYENSMIPLSWQESGAFQLTNGVYLAPDLSQLQVPADIGKLTTDPQRLLADANPLLKIPFETLIAKRKLYSDTPFKEGGVQSVSGAGLGPLTPILSALGLTSKAGDGTTVVNEKLTYALLGLNPIAQQSQRLTGDSPYYEDKRAQSLLNDLGIPVRFLTPGQKAAEQARRTRVANKKDPKMAALKAFKNG